MGDSTHEAGGDRSELNEEQLDQVEARLLARLRAERGGQEHFDLQFLGHCFAFAHWRRKTSRSGLRSAGLEMLFRLSGFSSAVPPGQATCGLRFDNGVRSDLSGRVRGLLALLDEYLL